jgi:hypothetical protein
VQTQNLLPSSFFLDQPKSLDAPIEDARLVASIPSSTLEEENQSTVTIAWKIGGMRKIRVCR